jgi:hypothetical protein
VFRSGVLPAQAHSVTVTVKGAHQPASTGNVVTVDRAVVTG